MAKLVLKFKDVEIRTYPFTKSGITVGRNEDNDIVVSNMAVSGYHAKLDTVGNNFFLTDLQSMNGTYLNDRKIVSTKLSNKDKITIGKHIIEFYMEDAEQKKSDATSEFDQTMYLDTQKAKELRAKSKGPKESQKRAVVAQVKQRTGVITFISGGEGEIVLKKKLIKIGKDETCDIIVSGMFVAGTAATISLRPSGYAITFAGGMAKLKVNGKTVKDSVFLKEFDMIELGSAKMQFYIK
ncbi:MAG: FHA domain-containing protein [Deltaproteobacteria bacterium]|nr:FHA domain-containing protein [Deltaproteobacteria bacterium]